MSAGVAPKKRHGAGSLQPCSVHFPASAGNLLPASISYRHDRIEGLTDIGHKNVRAVIAQEAPREQHGPSL